MNNIEEIKSGKFTVRMTALSTFDRTAIVTLNTTDFDLLVQLLAVRRHSVLFPFQNLPKHVQDAFNEVFRKSTWAFISGIFSFDGECATPRSPQEIERSQWKKGDTLFELTITDDDNISKIELRTRSLHDAIMAYADAVRKRNAHVFLNSCVVMKDADERFLALLGNWASVVHYHDPRTLQGKQQ